MSFSASEYQAATRRFEHTLIAKFQMGRPTLAEIRTFMASNWGFSKQCTISPCWDDRHIIIILDNEEDVCKALTFPVRKIWHTYFRLFRWERGYNPKKEIPKTTKWIRLPNLPIELFDRSFIKAIVSSFASFLDIDTRTKDLTALVYARACVELDVTTPIPAKVWINLPEDRGYYQDIIVEGSLAYCLKCRTHGHDVSSCRKGNKSNSIAPKDKPTNMANVPALEPNSGPDLLPRKDTDDGWKVVYHRKDASRPKIISSDPRNKDNLGPNSNLNKEKEVSTYVPSKLSTSTDSIILNRSKTKKYTEQEDVTKEKRNTVNLSN